jgi:Protein of unknown function (DUF2799)
MRVGALAILAMSAAGATLASCATMTANECAVADWRSLGVIDGQRGQGMEQYNRRQTACAKNAIAADFNAYQQGRAEGLRNFCQPANGFRVAMTSLAPPHADCPAELASGFETAVSDGAYAGQMLRAHQGALMQLRQAEARLDAIERELPEHERLATTAPVYEERLRQREQVLALREERARLRDALPAYAAEADQRDQELADARAQLGDRYGTW